MPVARTLKYLVWGALFSRVQRNEEKHIRINIQKALEYPDGGNQVSPKLSPLQGMKAQPLQSLFLWEVTHVICQPFQPIFLFALDA